MFAYSSRIPRAITLRVALFMTMAALIASTALVRAGVAGSAPLAIRPGQVTPATAR